MINPSGPQVDILLSTFNGSKFLDRQLASILNQSYQNWRLLIRDDASTDGTLRILDDFARQVPERTFIIRGNRRVGTVSSYAKLLPLADSKYVAFCDQDDEWATQKLEVQVETMLFEERRTIERPLLVHSDLLVVDMDGRMIHPSLWGYQKVQPGKCSTSRLLAQNMVTGCTVLINRELVQLLLPFPGGVIMHDWWMGLVAISFGEIVPISASLVYYRQHDSNQIGARRSSAIKFMQNGWLYLGKRVRFTVTQAQAFGCRYSGTLPTETRSVVKVYSEILSVGRLRRLYYMNKYGIYKQGFLRNLLYMATLFFLSKESWGNKRTRC